MIFEHTYRIRLEEVGLDCCSTDRAILAIMEDVGSLHSDSIGYGVESVAKTQKVWIVLDWQLEITDRPKYGETIIAKTWARKNNRVCAYRDFELVDALGNLKARGTSRWIYMDLENRKPLRLSEEMLNKYNAEIDKQVFETEIENPAYPKDFFMENDMPSIPYTVLRRDIDSNMHMHNINYLEAAYEILPQEVYKKHNWKNIRICYKKEIIYGENIICKYIHYNNKEVVGFTDDKNVLHAVIELY